MRQSLIFKIFTVLVWWNNYTGRRIPASSSVGPSCVDCPCGLLAAAGFSAGPYCRP